MAGRILGQHHLLALAVLDPQIIDAANLAARDHAVFRKSLMLRISPRATMPSPPAEKSTCWHTTGTVRESLTSSGANRAIMSSVPQRTWLWPLAKRSRAFTGSDRK